MGARETRPVPATPRVPDRLREPSISRFAADSAIQPFRLPSPAQWITIERMHMNDSFTHVCWMVKSDNLRVNNTKVLRSFKEDESTPEAPELQCWQATLVA